LTYAPFGADADALTAASGIHRAAHTPSHVHGSVDNVSCVEIKVMMCKYAEALEHRTAFSAISRRLPF
jgi:hypothetical protein